MTEITKSFLMFGVLWLVAGFKLACVIYFALFMVGVTTSIAVLLFGRS